MKTSPLEQKLLRILTLFVLAWCADAGAALTDIADAPLASSASDVVKPNISFVLDSSGSMAWTHAPDEALPFLTAVGYKSAQCNSIYYRPDILYVPPKHADGTDFPNANFFAAWKDGFDTSAGVVNLSSSFFAYDNVSSFGRGTDKAQPAYYYLYKGSATADFQNTGSLFYTECSAPTAGRGSPFVKVIVGSSSGPGNADERQNFANWFSYYRTRILTMKSGAGRAFASIGPAYRVGFMTIYATPNSTGSDPQYLPIDDFAPAQKSSWYSKFYAMSAVGATPLKAALSTAGRNFAGKLGPDPVQYSCQQNFLILTTDGYWNAGSANPANVLGGALSPASQDSDPAKTPPPMYDGALAGASNTLADGAAYYYNTDLRSSALGNCVGALGVGTDVCQDNVPTSGLDSAPWQHMTTFTLGLGTNGQLAFSSDYLKRGSTDFNAIADGSKNWPVPVGDTLTTIDDLWHAAVNGHGQYFSAKNPALLVSGLRDALAGVTARGAAGSAAATSNLEPVTGDNFVFVANYRTVKWDGDVQARSLDVLTGQITSNTLWSAQEKLDAKVPSTRKILTFVNGNQADFLPSSFSTSQKAAWFDPNSGTTLTQRAAWTPAQIAAATADTVINYLRGDTSDEERDANADKLYRTRDHILGDIVDGKPVYVKVPPFNYIENAYQAFKASVSTRQAALYVPANDGMLHAFNADNGDEMFAYVPSFVLPRMKALADDNYPNAHQFLTDASPTVSDIWTGSSWKTLLVAGLNAGGKGYYALDVSNPAAPAVMWEFTDPNMGLTFGNPVVGKLADGTWVVAVTSGYNNADGVGRLYVLNAATGKLIFSISTNTGTAGTPSGLARIAAWVDDSLNDNTLQRVYGGDLLGNLWRFDVNDILPPAGRDAVKLATLQVGTTVQPITTRPELGLFNNKPIVFVATGRYLGASDLNDTGQQSVYAIRDDLAANGVGNPRASSCPFVHQTLSIINANSRSTSKNPVDFARQCGWFLDFNPAGASPGERVNVDPQLQLGVLAVATNIPEHSVCTVGGSSFIYFLDYGTGGFVSTSLNGVAGSKIGNSITVGLAITRVGSCPDCGNSGNPGNPGGPTSPLSQGKIVDTATTAGGDYVPLSPPDNPLVGSVGKRVMWRELLN
ncbi:MAG TPA: PilC/PilY family type IV pilus protein [Usitatibacter sp.]|nr:PilC/PilY family type IV pilus protein [Usitatibacter sp.]